MKMNAKMSDLLKQTDTRLAVISSDASISPNFVVVEGSVLLRDEYQKAQHVNSSDFPDRTAFECFVNHVHLPYDGTRGSLQSCLHYATAVRKALTEFGADRRFLVIMSLSADGCVVRFHQCRPKESWLSEDLEGYAEEAVLVLPVEGRETRSTGD